MGPALRRSAAHKPSPWVGQHDPPYEDVARRRRRHHAEGACLRSPGVPPLWHDESPSCPPSRAWPSLSRAEAALADAARICGQPSPTSPVRRTPAFVPRGVWRRPSPRPCFARTAGPAARSRPNASARASVGGAPAVGKLSLLVRRDSADGTPRRSRSCLKAEPWRHVLEQETWTVMPITPADHRPTYFSPVVSGVGVRSIVSPTRRSS
jgi:hypothetical protein